MKNNMTREEAINEIRSWDFLGEKEIEAIYTLIPELKESDDERMLRKLIDHFDWHSNNRLTHKECDELHAWVKSFSRQPHWKPSEKQMEALICATEECGYNTELESLYNDLKKL